MEPALETLEFVIAPQVGTLAQEIIELDT